MKKDETLSLSLIPARVPDACRDRNVDHFILSFGLSFYRSFAHSSVISYSSISLDFYL